MTTSDEKHPPSEGGSGPWRLRLVCCGHDDGYRRCPTWDDAHDLRGSYMVTEGHERSAVLTYEPECGEGNRVCDHFVPHPDDRHCVTCGWAQEAHSTKRPLRTPQDFSLKENHQMTTALDRLEYAVNKVCCRIYEEDEAWPTLRERRLIAIAIVQTLMPHSARPSETGTIDMEAEFDPALMEPS